MLGDLLFLMFGGILILSALGVVAARNPMYCVLFMILAFFNSAGLFLLLGAEFIGLLMVMVYVGAIAVMFLFVLMTINIDFAVLKKTHASYLPLGLLVGFILLVEIGMSAWGGLFAVQKDVLPSLPMPEDVENITSLGQVLFTNYVYPFQVAAMILLVAMIGAIVLTHRSRGGVKKQDVSEQVNRKREDSMTIVKIKSGAAGTTKYFSKK